MATDYLDYSPNEYRKKYLTWTQNALLERARQPGITVVEKLVLDELLELYDSDLAVSHKRLVRNDLSDRIDGKPSVHVDNTIDMKPQSLLLNFVNTSQPTTVETETTLSLEPGQQTE